LIPGIFLFLRIYGCNGPAGNIQEKKMSDPFAIIDCALIAIATGQKAQNIREMHNRLLQTHDSGVIYYHFWGGLLRPHFVDPEYQNHFAGWAYHDLHDRRLAEKLSIINPADYSAIDELREEVIEVFEERMDEDDAASRVEAEHPFFFMRSQIVIFDTRLRVATPEKLTGLIPRLSLGSLFYHFIDSRRRRPSGGDDFSEWLKGWGDKYQNLIDEILTIDPYFNSLIELRQDLAEIFNSHLKTEK
jgi:hypothetical protein